MNEAVTSLFSKRCLHCLLNLGSNCPAGIATIVLSRAVYARASLCLQLPRENSFGI